MNTSQLATDCHIYLPTCGGFFLGDVLPSKDKLYHTSAEFTFNGILIKKVWGSGDRLVYYYGVNGFGAVKYSVVSRDTGKEVEQTFRHTEPLFILAGARNLHQAITMYTASLSQLVQAACAAFIGERNTVGGAMMKVQQEMAQKEKERAKAQKAGFGLSRGGVLLATTQTCAATTNGKHVWGVTPSGMACRKCGQKKV